jgi:hypothetical protein
MAQQIEENTDLLLELLGTLVYIPTDKWEQMIEEYSMIEYLYQNLQTGFAEDDIMLESVMLVGTICRNETCATLIS